MRSTKALSPSKFFGGNRYAAYLDELTSSGTIAGQRLSPAERKEGFRKRADKINFEKFVNKVLEKKTGPAMGSTNRALPGGGRGGAIVKTSGNVAQSFVSSPVTEKTQENLDDVLKGIDSILETLRAEQKFKKQVVAKEKRKQERERRSASEDKLEKKAFSGLGKAVSKVLKPVKSIFDKLFDFIFNVLIGRVLIKLIDWFSDENNKGKINAIGRFLKDTWPAILAGFLLFGTGLGGFLKGLVGLVTFFIPKILKLTGKLISIAVRNPLKTLAVAGIAAAGYGLYQQSQTPSNDPEAAPGQTQLDDTMQFGGTTGDPMGALKFSIGGRVPGSGNADTVPAMLTPGEFVMSRGAVSKYGVGFMQGINSAGGGGRTSKPGYYSSGGEVPPNEEPGARISPDGTARPNISASGVAKSSGSGGTLSLTAQDFRDLAYIVSAEAARNTDDEYGVAAAVLNRLTDPNWPNTIAAVGSQSGQFEAVYTGKAYDDPELAKKLASPQGQAKIAEALKILNGRTDFKGQSQLGNKGSTDPMFHPSGNFYHYTSQVGKSDPVPSNPPQNWRRLIGTGGPAVTLASTSGPSTTLSSGVTRGSASGSSYSGNITAAKPKASVKPPSQADIKSMLDSIKLAVDAPMSITPSPGVSLPDLNAAVMHDPRKVKVLGIG